MKFWTLQDEDGSCYINEFRKFGDDELTDEDAVKARMEFNTMKDFYNNGFKQVRVEIKVCGER